MKAKDIAVSSMMLTSALVACSDPIVGDWKLVSTSGAQPDSVTLYDTACGYVTLSYSPPEFEGELEVEDDLQAELKMDVSFPYTYTSEYCGTGSGVDGPYATSMDGDVEVRGDGDYDINLDGDLSLELECSLRGDDELECDTTLESTRLSFTFERR